MTKEEKAIAYDKALEMAKEILNSYEKRGLKELLFYAKEDLEGIFPELKESGDERIRKELIEKVKETPACIGFSDKNAVIAWLEKQGTHSASI